jgi:AAA domain
MLMTEVQDRDPDAPSRWWPGRLIEGDWAFWIAKKKTGKGLTLEGDVAARFTRGWEPPPNNPYRADAPKPRVPQYVIIVAPEDKAQVLRERLLAHGGDPAYVEIMSQVQRQDAKGGLAWDDFSCVTDIPLLERRIRQLARGERDRATGKIIKPGAGTGLVIMDPLMAVCGGSTVAFNQQVRQNVIRPLQRSAEKLGYCGVMVGHFTKGVDSARSNPNKSLSDYVGGSEGLLAAFRLSVVMWTEDDGEVSIQTLESNEGTCPEQRFRIVAEGVDDPDAHIEWIQPRPALDAEGMWDELQARFETLMIEAGRPLTLTELTAVTGLAYEVVKQIIRRGRMGGVFAERDGGWVCNRGLLHYAPPAALPSAEPQPADHSRWPFVGSLTLPGDED